VWAVWDLVHSRITFYVYAKIGQVNGGGRRPPLDRPLFVIMWTSLVKI